MTKKRFLALLIISLVCLVWIARWEFAQPTYHGKTIRVLSANLFAQDQKTREEAQAAFHSLGASAVPNLVRLLKAKDSVFRRTIDSFVRTLPAARRKLVERHFPPSTGFSVPVQAAHALGEIGPAARQAIPALSASLREKNAMVRMEAATALGHIGRDAVPALLSALSDNTPEIRRVATSGMAVAAIPADIATPILLRVLQDPDSSVISAASAAISQRGNDSLSSLTNLIQTGDVRTRVLAARALTMFRPNRQIATPVLIKLAGDEDEGCRLQAIKTLTTFQLPNRLILDAFCSAAKDPIAEVRGAAVQGLAQARQRVVTVLPELTQSLGDPAPEVREASARGIGSLGVAAIAALPKLTEVAADENNPAHIAALEAIQKIELAELAQLEE